MELSRFKWTCLALVVVGLVVSLPTVAGEVPYRDTDDWNTGEAVGYRPTVEPRTYPPYEKPVNTLEDATLTPANVSATVSPGGVLEEHKVLHMPEDVIPPMADVVFMIDLTGSMTDELENVKTSAVDIMEAVRLKVADTYFGVISHMDYLGEHYYCDYQGYYGSSPDYPYALGQNLTGNMTSVETAINALSLGHGEDGPESYSRALYEAYNDPAVGWRPGAKRFIVQFGDNVPHDCDVLECIAMSGALTTGIDLGDDNTVGTSDDLYIMDVVDGLVASNICLIPLFSGTFTNYFDSWDCWAAETGCEAFQINTDGTVPGGIDIAQYIADAIEDQFGHINTLTLEVCDPAWAAWLTDVDPPSYDDVDLDVPRDFDFDIDFTVPAGTDPGQFCFDVCAMGDNVEYARQHVCITVPGDDCIHLDIGEVYGDPGDDVWVPVYIQDVTGWDIFAFEAKICWCEIPENLLQYEGCMIGEVMSGSYWGDPVCGTCDDNCITVAGAGSGPLTGGGVLFWLKFHISLNAKPGMCCEICFDYAHIYDPEQPLEVCLECGEVCVNECGIGGSVYTWWCRLDPCCGWVRYVPIPGVRMHLYDCDGPLNTQYTNAAGQYYFGGLPPMEGCPYCVSIDFCPAPREWVNAYDAALVLRYVVCDIDLAACPFDVCVDQDPISSETVYPQRVAANVNCAGDITAFDASEILRYAVGALPAFACPDPWAWFLLDDCDNCAPTCPYTFDWVGVFIGDVSGLGPPALTEPTGTAKAKIGIPRHFDDKVEVPLLVDEVTLADDVVAIEFDLTFNSGDFAVVAVSPTGVAGGYLAGFNPVGDQLFIAMAGVNPIPGPGEVARITFQKIRPLVPTASPRVHIDNGMFNEGNPAMVIEETDEGKEIWRLGLDPASPNPFAEQTALRFHLAKESNVMLAVYNVNGQLVRTLRSGTVAAGTHRVTWDGRDDAGERVAKGVYFCRMETEDFSATEKVVMLK